MRLLIQKLFGGEILKYFEITGDSGAWSLCHCICFVVCFGGRDNVTLRVMIVLMGFLLMCCWCRGGWGSGDGGLVWLLFKGRLDLLRGLCPVGSSWFLLSLSASHSSHRFVSSASGGLWGCGVVGVGWLWGCGMLLGVGVFLSIVVWYCPCVLSYVLPIC